jgi:hypothetical protein
MVTKNTSSKKKSSSKSTALAQAAKKGDATAALMAVSSNATAADSVNSTIFQCVVGAFDKEGLNHINNMQAKIVWIDIQDDVIVKLGDDVTDCLSGHGIDVPELSVPFMNLKAGNKTTVVSDLVTAIGKLA